MWSEVLSQPASLYDEEYAFLKFGQLVVLSTSQGIRDEEWRRSEDRASLSAVRSDRHVMELFNYGERVP